MEGVTHDVTEDEDLQQVEEGELDIVVGENIDLTTDEVLELDAVEFEHVRGSVIARPKPQTAPRMVTPYTNPHGKRDVDGGRSPTVAWRLVSGFDPYGHRPVGISNELTMKNSVFTGAWVDVRKTDCEGLPMTVPARIPPSEMLPHDVTTVTPVITFNTASGKYPELRGAEVEEKAEFRLGMHDIKFPVYALAVGNSIDFWPARTFNGKVQRTPESFQRMPVPVRVRFFVAGDLYGEFWLPARGKIDWAIPLNEALQRVPLRYHPGLSGAVYEFSRFLALDMAQMRPTFYADDSRMEAKSIVWMQQRIPPRICALHPLLKPAAAVFLQRPVSTVSGRWGAFFKDGLVTHVVNRARGIDLVCVQFPGKGSLVVERCGNAEYFFLSLPVMISEENFDSSPTLRAWLFTLPTQRISSLPSWGRRRFYDLRQERVYAGYLHLSVKPLCPCGKALYRPSPYREPFIYLFCKEDGKCTHRESLAKVFPMKFPTEDGDPPLDGVDLPARALEETAGEPAGEPAAEPASKRPRVGDEKA